MSKIFSHVFFSCQVFGLEVAESCGHLVRLRLHEQGLRHGKVHGRAHLPLETDQCWRLSPRTLCGIGLEALHWSLPCQPLEAISLGKLGSQGQFVCLCREFGSGGSCQIGHAVQDERLRCFAFYLSSPQILLKSIPDLWLIQIPPPTTGRGFQL